MLDAAAEKGGERAISKYLENTISPAQYAPFLEGVSEMAKRINQRIEIGKDEEGKPRYKWVEGHSQQEVVFKAAKALIEAGVFSPCMEAEKESAQAPVFFKAYAQKWKQLYKDGKKRHTTLSEYQSILNKHLYPAFGDMDIRAITIDDVQMFMNTKEHYAAKTIEEMRMVLGMVLEAAREDGIITSNPARSTRLSNPSTKVSIRKPLTEEQAADVIAHIDDLTDVRDRLYVAMLMFTGMRRNEVLGLRREDIDFDHGLIHIYRGVTFKGNRPVIGHPKTKAGTRALPLHPQLRHYLESCKENGFIIGGCDEPITQQIAKRMWQRIKKTINVYDKTPHNFRHTFMTFAWRAGVQEKTLQTIGGYSDAGTLRNIYMHTQDVDIQKASGQMVEMFGAN